jgi:GNAT superfamily N-acetyltransferase
VTATDSLLAAQDERFARLDRVLPPLSPPERGDLISAALPDGRRVAGVVVPTISAPGLPQSLWSATHAWELQPVVGDTGAAGMDALLHAWRRWFEQLGESRGDTAAIVLWPSRDAECARAFLDHGFQPLTVTAVRAAAVRPLASMSISVRTATYSDMDVLTELAMAELRYSAMVGAAIVRPDAEAIRRDTMAGRLARDEEIWVAELDGVVVAMAEVGIVPCSPMLKTSRQLPTGRWGYVNCLSVLPGARDSGIGQQLMAVVHNKVAGQCVVGHFLHYNPPNPLSSVFWPRQGYRPLWTQWELRPVSALR